MVKRRPKPVHQMTLGQFEAAFPDEEHCAKYLVARRWPEGIHCPRCFNAKVFPVKSMPFKWQCYQCETIQGAGYRFSHIAGTIFENTNKPLRDWFKVVHLMLTSKKGISALQIQRMMGFGSYETAHSMCHKIRGAGSGKIPVIGAAQRKGNIIARALSHVTRQSAEMFVNEMISDKVS